MPADCADNLLSPRWLRTAHGPCDAHPATLTAAGEHHAREPSPRPPCRQPVRPHGPPGGALMFRHPCECGHTSEQHYTRGMARSGGCKERGCACPGFAEASKP